MIRALRIISLSAGCIFLISAVTGIQRLHFSTETGFSVAMHTTATRLIALVVGLVFVAWFFGLRQDGPLGNMGHPLRIHRNNRRLSLAGNRRCNQGRYRERKN